jgi:23S rRNA (cytosine1962-C5)-methyltransferase
MNRSFADHWKDYELIDAGGDKKLERWGDIITIRPDRNAYFKAVLPYSKWLEKAHFVFEEESHTKGKWKSLELEAEENWDIVFKDLKFNLKLTRFKHLGLFPEQNINWSFVMENLHVEDRFLNLFGYTGAASLAARKKGAKVIHCDSVKQVIQWGRENMEASSLDGISWVLEDALKFAGREVKRGNKYKGVIMDPPAYGIGAKGERWKIENKIDDLMSMASELIEKGGFLILNTYSPKLQEKEILQLSQKYFPQSKHEVSTLCIKSTTGKVIEYGVLSRIIL